MIDLQSSFISTFMVKITDIWYILFSIQSYTTLRYIE